MFIYFLVLTVNHTVVIVVWKAICDGGCRKRAKCSINKVLSVAAHNTFQILFLKKRTVGFMWYVFLYWDFVSFIFVDWDCLWHLKLRIHISEYADTNSNILSP
jgi:hypothetical protein